MTHLVYVSRDVYILDDDQQSAVGVFFAQEGHGTLLHVALLQQVFLQRQSTNQGEHALD